MKTKYGSTRIVFLVADRAIKIPNVLYSWHNFLSGLMANIQEVQTYRYNLIDRKEEVERLLCPILWASWGGWIVVMKRADMERHLSEIRNLEPVSDFIGDFIDWQNEFYKAWILAGFGGDDQPLNYGYIEDRLVKIDYGSI